MWEEVFSREGSKELSYTPCLLQIGSYGEPPSLPNLLIVGLGKAKAVLASACYSGWARAALASPQGQISAGWRAIESQLVLPPRWALALAARG